MTEIKYTLSDARYREVDGVPEKLPEQLVFAGLIGMLDPPGDEVHAAIQECKSAGINVTMITGDHPATAKSIGLKLGLIDSENGNAMHRKEMAAYENLSPEEKQKWMETKIFARVSPKQKLDLVTVLQENHFVVGMTGDGVNDALALRKADTGIAMGLRGTQVAQKVAYMVLKDDSFSSIVLAIKQGRIIFENIRKFIVYLFLKSEIEIRNLHQKIDLLIVEQMKNLFEIQRAQIDKMEEIKSQLNKS